MKFANSVLLSLSSSRCKPVDFVKYIAGDRRKGTKGICSSSADPSDGRTGHPNLSRVKAKYPEDGNGNSSSLSDLSHRFLIYRNTVTPLSAGQGFKWTIDLWVLPPTDRGQGIGSSQVRYLLQRPDIRILEVGNAANYTFWKRFQQSSVDSDRETKEVNEDSDCRGYMLLKKNVRPSTNKEKKNVDC